jgi:hypothetical protein
MLTMTISSGRTTIKSSNVQVRWLALCWEAFQTAPGAYGVYAMGPSEDMDTPDGCLLGTYKACTDAADAAHEAARDGMWPDSENYWIEVRNLGAPAGIHGWDSVETDTGDECPW